jgi:hypothetical protein
MTKVALGLVLIIEMTAIAVAQPPPPVLPSCTKTITFSAAAGGQPVPAIPKFAAKWIGKTKHIEGYPDMCLSQMPSSSTANYVVIFATSEAGFDGLTPVAHTYASSSPTADTGTGISSYGGTWSYSYAGRVPPPTTSSTELQRIDASKKELVLRAYDQHGRLVAHYSVDSDHKRETRLEQVLADIHRDVVEKLPQRSLPSSLSVYYVNCDVDSPGPASPAVASDPLPASPGPKSVATTAASAPIPSSPPPPPQATLELVSDPARADVYVDGNFVGKSPLTTTLPPGEHVVVMRKADFSSWGRKLQLVPGPRRLVAHLERKFLELSPATAPAQ